MFVLPRTAQWNEQKQHVTPRIIISHLSSVLEFASSEANHFVLSSALKSYMILIYEHAFISISMSSTLVPRG